MIRTWIEAQAERVRKEKLTKALAKVEKDIKDAQHQLASLGFTNHDRTTQIALRQELRRALLFVVRYQELAKIITPEQVDEHLKEPANYAA